MAETDSAVAHCPVSNTFIRSGVMPLAEYQDAGLRIGLGTDVAGAPELSVITQMRAGFFQHNARLVEAAEQPARAGSARMAPPGHAGRSGGAGSR